MLILLTFATEEERLKFERLFEKYQKLLLHKAFAILNDYALAEDAVSEAYIRIYRSLSKIEDTESPRTVSFLLTIVKNAALTILAAQQKSGLPQEDIEDESSGYDMEEDILSAAVAGDMQQIIGGLKEDLRAPFLLKYAHGLSHREIAALLHISENNVNVRIHRAKTKLAELFREAGYA